jgi:hypothetical protein
MDEKFLIANHLVPDNEVWVSPKTFESPFSKNTKEALPKSPNKQSTPFPICGGMVPSVKIKVPFAKNVREWFAFFGGEELGISLEHASIIWDAAIKNTEKSRTSTNNRRNAICHWKYCGDDGYWHTSCGEDFVFNDGTPQENGVLFCYHCGKHAFMR